MFLLISSMCLWFGSGLLILPSPGCGAPASRPVGIAAPLWLLESGPSAGGTAMAGAAGKLFSVGGKKRGTE